jgi:hypothetical protein
MDVPEVLKIHIEKTHKELDTAIITIREQLIEHGSRLIAVEKEIAMFKEHLTRIEHKQENIDKNLNAFILQVPSIIEDRNKGLITEVSYLLDEKFQMCRNIQDNKNEKAFLKLPPGFWGNFIKVVIFLICFGGGYITVDMFLK